ncbi:hypothetical protein LLH23_23645 [bacterium]|nr:hypothetical protein [bacterium]
MDVAYLVGALVLALVHVLSGRLNLSAIHHRRRWLSLAAGVSVAYVFLDLLPLMGDKQRIFLEAAGEPAWPVHQFRVYAAALLGFTVFYGLEQLMARRQASLAPTGAEDLASGRPPVLLHLSSFAAYNLMMGYLLVEWARGLGGLALYCGALALHLVVTDEGMRRDYDRGFQRVGRWLMAACIVVGAVVARAAPLSIDWLTIIVGLVAGGVVVNSIKDDLPQGSDGRFAYFVAGTVGYGLMVAWAAWLETVA